MNGSDSLRNESGRQVGCALWGGQGPSDDTPALTCSSSSELTKRSAYILKPAEVARCPHGASTGPDARKGVRVLRAEVQRSKRCPLMSYHEQS